MAYSGSKSALLIACIFCFSHSLVGQKAKNKQVPPAPYYPDKEWQIKKPSELKVDPIKLKEAIDFAIARETKAPRNLEIAHYQTFGREPFGDGIGPFSERGDPTGIIIRNGYIIAEWGDPQRVEMTFSVTKSFLSATVGIAFDKGLIKSIRDTVRNYVGPVLSYQAENKRDKPVQVGQPYLFYPFDTQHNRTITWDDLLRQTSDWEGTLWSKPDWADRPTGKPEEWTTRARNKPGTVYEYNDVRVNALALAALQILRKPLPQVLKENIMDPIGASSTWRWYGYDNSWIVLDGQAVQSVSGGGHWGGGMFISARDMARFGLLTLRKGKWNDRQLLSTQWVAWALTPTLPEPTYGFMNWFLNTEKKFLPSAPATTFVHLGNGTNIILCDPDHDLVAVVRWIDRAALDEFVKKMLGSISP